MSAREIELVDSRIVERETPGVTMSSWKTIARFENTEDAEICFQALKEKAHEKILRRSC